MYARKNFACNTDLEEFNGSMYGKLLNCVLFLSKRIFHFNIGYIRYGFYRNLPNNRRQNMKYSGLRNRNRKCNVYHEKEIYNDNHKTCLFNNAYKI